MNETLKSFAQLLDIMDELRAKCPWDKEQTFESLRKLTIEETYELADAIIEGKLDEIKKELGDILLHIVFYSKIGSETGKFNINDVIKGINKKLIFRHPHVFGNTEVNNADDVKTNWEELKIKEGNKTILGGVPMSLPALVKANRIQEKVRSIGFDWEKREDVWEKVKEELNELINEVNDNNKKEQEKEFGDLLFSVINAARLYEIDPENALEKTNRKFIKRFNYVEEKTLKQGKELKNMTLAEMDKLWEEAKQFDNI